MTRKSHYSVLGIGRNENADGVRAAYIRLVKDLHPDHSGVPASEAFRAVQEAYDVLSDPIRRRAYDRELNHARPARRRRTAPIDRRRPVEPLIPDTPLVPAPSMRRSSAPGGIEALLEDLLEELGVTRGVGGPGQPAPDVEVVVPAEIAIGGGDIGVEIPIRQRCDVCGGTGIAGFFGCRRCGQTGSRTVRRAFRMTLPPGVRSGTVVRIEAEPGAPLNIRLRVDQRWRSPPIR